MSRWLLALFCLLALQLHALQFTRTTPGGELSWPPFAKVVAADGAIYASGNDSLYRSTDGGGTWTDIGTPPNGVDDFTAGGGAIYVISARHPYRSTDGGATWKELTRGVPSSGFFVGSFFTDPQNPDTLYVASRCASHSFIFDSGVFRSTDRGETWSVVADTRCTETLSIDPASPQNLFADYYLGAALLHERSMNAGATWSGALNVPATRVVDDPVDPARRYGIGGSDVLVSTDAGATWTKASSFIGAMDLAIDPQRRLFLASRTSGLFVSSDFGSGWARVTSVPQSVTSIAIDGGVLFAATSDGMYRVPLDDFAAARPAPVGEQLPQSILTYELALDPNDASTLYANGVENPGGAATPVVFRSRDGGHRWQRITSADDTALRQDIGVDAAGDLYASLAATRTMWRFANGRWESWTAPELKDTVLYVNPHRIGWLYAVSPYGSYYSADGGHTWFAMPRMYALAIASNGSDLMSSNGSSVLASSDGGVTWRDLGIGALTKRIAFAPSQPSTIYRISTADYPRNAMFRSDDGGATWKDLGTLIFSSSAPSIAVDPFDHRNVWFDEFHSTDGGQTFTPEPSNAGIFDARLSIDGRVMYTITRSEIWQATIRGNHRRAIERR